MSLERVPPGRNLPDDFNVIIEIPMNADPIKYEVDKETGALFVDRFIGTAMHYPCNYGYIPHTIADDGDPVDVLVITPLPVTVGVVIRCRPLGVLKMEDEAGGDAKLLAVPIDKVPAHLQALAQGRTTSRPERLAQIQHFFEHYKDLEARQVGQDPRMGGSGGRRERRSWPASRRYRQSDAETACSRRAQRGSLRSRGALPGRSIACSTPSPRARGTARPPNATAAAPASATSTWCTGIEARAPSCARPARRLRSTISLRSIANSIIW